MVPDLRFWVWFSFKLIFCQRTHFCMVKIIKEREHEVAVERERERERARKGKSAKEIQRDRQT